MHIRRRSHFKPAARRLGSTVTARGEPLEPRLVLSIQLSSTAWTAIGPAPLSSDQSYSGRIAGIAADPNDSNTIYIAAAGGGVWKTTNGGQGWSQLTDSQATDTMGAIAVASCNPNVIYAGTGEANNSLDSNFGRGILVSTDGGSTWTLQTAGGAFDRRTVSKIAIDPNDANTAYAAIAPAGANGLGGSTGIWKTTDGGATWTNTTAASIGDTNDAYSDVAIDPNNPSTLFAAIGNDDGASANGIYKSTDSGGSWQLLGNFPSGASLGRIALAVSSSNSQVVYATVAGDGQKGSSGYGSLDKMERSDDGGNTWNDLTGATPDFMSGQGWYNLTIAVDPANSATVYAAGSANYTSNGIIESTNSGASWSNITSDDKGNSPHTDWHATTFDAAGHLLAGSDGGIWRMDADPGNASGFLWTNLNGDLNTIQFEGVAIDPKNANDALGGSQDNGVELFTGNAAWSQVEGGDGGRTRYSGDAKHAYSISPGSPVFSRSDDGGITWAAKSNGINANDSSNFYPPFVVDPNDGNHVLLGTDQIYATTNAGDGWTRLTGIGIAGWNPQGNAVDAIAIAASDANRIYAATGGDGATSSQIFTSADGGASYKEIDLPTGNGRVSDLDVDPTNALTAYAVVNRFTSGAGHVFKTTDGGSTWTDISGNLSNLPVWSVRVDSAGGTIYIGADDGVYNSTDGGTTWARFGTGFPDAQVRDLAYSPTLNLLGAGTHGRGMWEIEVPQATAAPQITSAASANFTVGQQGSFTVTATGTPKPTLSESGALPSGVTFDSGKGLLSGTPAAGTGGTYSITFTAHNGIGSDAVQSFTLVVEEAPSITSAASTTFIVGVQGSFTVTTGGYPMPTLSESGSLPSGVTFDASTGVLSGTPAAGTAATYAISFTAYNGIGSDATQSFTLTVNQPPAITSVAATTFTVGQQGSFTVTATGVPTPTLIESGTLPTGVTFDAASGTLAGTPAVGTGGAYGIVFTAHNGVGSDAVQSFNLTVDEAPDITSAASAVFTAGQQGSFTVTDTGFPTPTLSESGALPRGVSFDPTSGILSGTPAAGTGGVYSFSFTADNGVGSDSQQSFTLTVNEAPAITSPTQITFAVGVQSSFTVTSTGFPAPTLSESGTLPSGVTFDAATDALAGTPATGTGGVYRISFTASNGVGNDAVQNFLLFVSEPIPPAITSAANVTFTVGVAGIFTVATTGAPTPTLSETGTLPAGVTFDPVSGALAGTPAAGSGGVYDLTFTADNGVGSAAVQPFVLTVNAAPAITSGDRAFFAVGVQESFLVQASGFPTPMLSESGPLPSGVTFDASTGTLAGMAASGTGGTYALTFTAHNGVGADAVQAFILTVAELSPPAIESANHASFTVGRLGNFTVEAAGFPPPRISESGALPGGVTFDPTTGTIAGKPSAGSGGNYAITFTAHNGVGSDVLQNFTLSVNSVAVNQAPSFTSANYALFLVGSAASFAVTASGFPTPALSESGALPNGVTFDPASGLLAGTPATGTSGTYDIQLTAHNGVGSDALQKFTLTVITFVNQSPSFLLAAGDSTLENNTVAASGGLPGSGSNAQQIVVPNFALGIVTGPAGVPAETVTFFVSTDRPDLFAQQPTIDGTATATPGTLRFALAQDVFGVADLTVYATNDGGSSNGGSDTSLTHFATITVNGIDDPPTLEAIADPPQVLQDTTPSPITLSGITAGPNESQALIVSAAVSPRAGDNAALVTNLAVQYSKGNSTATLSYSLGQGQFGTEQITVTVNDNGAGTMGGVNTFTQSFVVTVESTIPTAAPQAVTTLENVPTTIVLAGNDPAGKLLSAVISSLPTGGNLYQTTSTGSQGAAITSVNTVVTGPLVYVPAIDANDSPYDAFAFYETEVNGTQSSTPAEVTISVTPVNQPPTFVAGPNQSLTLGAGAQAISGWATQVAPGPANESNQKVHFNVLSDSDPGLFRVPPQLDPAGTLTYTPAAGETGTAILTLDLQDDGGTANGGHDTSAPQNVTITVSPVPPAPLANADTYVLSTSASSSAASAGGVLANDVSRDGQGAALRAVLISSTAHGTLSLGADGSFTYTPGPGFEGLDQFTYEAVEEPSASAPAMVTLLSYQASIVDKLYNQVLGRSADPQGLQFWTTQVISGASYGAVAQGIFESNERLSAIIAGGRLGNITYPGYYAQFLLRPADPAGLAYWEGLWKQDGGPDHVIAGMIGSPEFYASAGQRHPALSPNAAWVTALYERLLNREPDGDGLRYWTTNLDNGAMSRDQVVLGFVDSNENFQNLTTGFFQEYLGRAPTSAELATRVDQFQSGASQRDVQLAIIDLPEYANTPTQPAPGSVGKPLYPF
jgi:photosystem II stability/assembly factor-like uncharacterized protein